MSMVDAEWRTYLSLEEAGLAAASPESFPSPPWEVTTAPHETGELQLPSAAAFLRELFERRRSSRALCDPLPIACLRDVLALATASPGERPGSRPYPTSGGCDELGIVVLARNVVGLTRGAYWLTGSSERQWLPAPSSAALDEFERRAYPFLGLSEREPPAATLVVLADWRRLAARYRHCVLASGLWDCGALLQTLSLAAAAVDVEACICASVQPKLVDRWLELDCMEVGHVGTFALGGQSRASRT